MSHSPTPEQSAILDACASNTDSLMISAYAGTGKTTTLVMMTERLSAVPSLALAFNVKIKKELETRFPAHFTVKTMNGLGHGAWSRYVQGRLTLDDRKLGKLVTATACSAGQTLDTDTWSDVLTLVTAAMNVGLVPSYFPIKGMIVDTPAVWTDLALEADVSPDLCELAREVLIANIKQGLGADGPPTISYNDQIYLPTVLGAKFDRFPLVMVDEAQDLSPLQHEMVRRSAGDRLIVVGDPRQALYAFRGADSSSMERLRGLRQQWIDLPLTLTFRCPHAIVDRQQDHAPGYTAAPSNPQGAILDRRGQEWSWADIPPSPSVAVLCRNNAPLMSLALKLLARHISCVMLGSDIGKGLKRLAKKLLPNPNLASADCITLINAWAESESSLARANQKEHKIAGIEDRAACLCAVLEHCANAGELIKTLTSIFSNDHTKVTLASGHRSKGLEWDTVVHLDPFRIPSKFARKAAAAGNPKQLEQEFNLRYVIETRAKQTLVLADLADFV